MSLSLLCFKFYFLLSNHPASPAHALSSSPPSPFPIDLHGRVSEQHNNSECTTMAMVVHSPLRRVAVARVCTKDLRYLRESTIEAPGMLKHVALQKTKATMINPIGHPNAAIAVSSCPSTSICTLRSRSKVSSSTTSPHTLCSLHERPRDPHYLDDDARRMRRHSHRVGWLHLVDFFPLQSHTILNHALTR
jgi:hypothetical protein